MSYLQLLLCNAADSLLPMSVKPTECGYFLSKVNIWNVNPLRAKFFRVNINMYLHSMSFLRTNETQVVEIPPRVRQGPAYTT